MTNNDKAAAKQESLTPAQLQREARSLRRLETLIDCVFALVIVLIVFDLPDQEGMDDLVTLIRSSLHTLVGALVGIVVVLVYWFQSNLLLGNLIRTNSVHGFLSLLQVFFVLVYLLAVNLGNRFGDATLSFAQDPERPFAMILRIRSRAELDDQVEACRRIFSSDTRWTVVRGSDLEEGESQGLPVWSQHVGDPILESNLTRRIDFALFMVHALENDALIHKAPAIVGCQSSSAIAAAGRS